MTVSNAFNRPDKLSAELRERIIATAATLGYAGPDPMARSLRQGRVGALGVVLGESLAYAFDDPGAMQLLRGLAGACCERGAGLQLIPTTGDDADGRLVQDAAVDAFILFGLPDDHLLVAASLRRGRPVLTSGGPQLVGHSFVGIDDRSAARAAATHLLDQGHRNLAVISFPLDARRHATRAASLARQRRATFRVARERLAGYRSACMAAGAPWSEVAVYEVPMNSRHAGHDAALELLRAAPHTTAILAMSDELALGALDAAEVLHRSVPTELSVVGWDDNPSASASTPPLTTIHQSLRDQGRLLGQLALTQPTEATTTNGPWSFVLRESTAASRQQAHELELRNDRHPASRSDRSARRERWIR